MLRFTSVNCSLAMAVVLLASVHTAAPAQSLNIDFGSSADAPSSAYAAAGLPGVWNSIPALHGTTTFNLLDLSGNATPVQLLQIGGLQTLSVDDPQTAGDDGALMDDYLVTYDAGLESCLYLRYLESGRYRVILYARMPNQPLVMSYTSCDEEPGFPHHHVGGPWPGAHVELVTYSNHIAVPDDVYFRIRAHSGIAPGASASLGAALNGMQLIKINPGDVDGSGQVDINDLLKVVNGWGACPAISGTCEADIAPYPYGDGSVNVNDLLSIIQNWG